MTPESLSIAHDVTNATIIDRHDPAPGLTIIRVRPDSGVVPEYLPGQFTKLGLPRAESEEPVVRTRSNAGPRLVRRAYSIASSPRQREYLEFLIVRVEAGKLTPKLWTLHEGGRVWMDEKVAGHFTLEPIPPGKDIVMMSTGTGIAPFISMVRTYADQLRWRRAVVVNGVRYEADLSYRDELEELARVNPRIIYIPVVSREPDWLGLRGHVQQVLEPGTYDSRVGAPLAPAECHVMLCGNPEMIVSVQRILEERGFHTHSPTQPGNIHYERYW